MTEIYTRLLDILDEMKLNIADLSRISGVPDSSIRSWKKSAPNIDMALKVADALRVPLEFLVTGRHSTLPDIGEKELRLLQDFRQLSADKQGTLLLMAHTFVKEEHKKASELSENLNETLSGLTVN